MRQRPALRLGTLGRILERFRASLFVHVQRVHLVLAIEAGHQLVKSGNLDHLHFADDEVVE
jgi:hypothetical protein